MSQVPRPSIHALTVDVEDWYTGIPIDQRSIGQSDYRLRSSMDTLLRILDEYGTKGTFFWLGELAEKYPDLVRTVMDAGHRIGCHGWFHTFVRKSQPVLLEKQVSEAKNLLENITGSRILSFRAPFFSISRDTLWVLDMLSRLGFTMDSSIFPAMNWRYGIPGFPCVIRKIRRKNGSIWLAPITTRKFLGISVPVSGGAYLRIFPFDLTRSNFRWAERRGHPVVFYLHPWELDPDHPRRSFDLRARLTHYAGLSSCEGRLRMLLSEFRFEPLENVVDRVSAFPPPPGGTPLLWSYGVAQRSSAHCRTLTDCSPRPRVLLDIGTRDAGVLAEVSRALGAGIGIGIDLETGRFPVPSTGTMVLMQADGEAIPLRSGTVDVILCTSTFKHIWHADAMLDECARVLRPGGQLSLLDVTPAGIRFGIAAGYFMRGAIQRTLDLNEFCTLLTLHGFEVIHRERFMTLPLRVPGRPAIEALLRRRGLDRFMFYQLACGRLREGWESTTAPDPADP